MDKIKRKYNKLIKEMNKSLNNTERYHDLRDQIYELFITDISNKNITTAKDIKIISDMLINEIIKKKIDVWYA